MIAAGDDIARSAFWLALREQPSSPSLVTQELDPSDILEVRDVAEAIARAEALVRKASLKSPAPPASPVPDRTDLFDALGARPTDDAAGPAAAALSRPSTLPPPPAACGEEPTELLTEEDVELLSADEPPVVGERGATEAVGTDAAASAPERAAPMAPILRIQTANARDRVPGPEDDAYFHPGGRIRGMADVTLDGRPEPTLLVRLRARRGRLSRVVGGALVALATLAGAALLAPGRADVPEGAVTKGALQGTHGREPPTRVAWTSTRAKLATLQRAETQARRVATTAAAFDVKTLPRAR